MKKLFLALSVFVFVLSASFISVIAYFSPNVHFVHTRTQKYPVSFSYLMELCDYANVNIANGTFPDQSSLPSNPSARIVKVNSNYVVALYSGNTDITYSLCPSNKTDGCYYYSSDNFDPDFIIYSISTSCSNMEGYLYSIQNMLTSSLPALFTTQTGQGTFSVAELQYKVWQAVDGLESTVSSIDTKLSTTNTRLLNIYNRLAKTVSGTTYTAADLFYNVWQQTITNGGYVDGVEGSLNTISGYVDGIEGKLDSVISYVDGIEGSLGTLHSDLSSSNQTMTDIKSVLDDINTEQIASSYTTDATGNDWETIDISYEAANEIVAYLNTHYVGKKVSIIGTDLTQDASSRYFIRAYLAPTLHYIVIRCSTRDDGTHSVYAYYMCDRHHAMYVYSDPTYQSQLQNIYNKLNNLDSNIDVDIVPVMADLDAYFADMTAYVSGVATAVANINTSFSLGGLKISIGDSPSNPIYTTPASNDLYLSSYLTDAQGVSYDVISSPYQSSTDIIGYINAEMVGKPIKLLPRQGTREEALTRYVDHAYLDENNYIKVLAKTAAGAVYSYFLASPELAIYQSLANDLFFDDSAILQVVQDIDTEIHSANNLLGAINGNTDGLESQINSLSHTITDIYDTNTAILAHMDSSDLVDDDFISAMVDDWGDHLVYTVLTSDNVLSLFNSAFGDLPDDMQWGEARNFFQAFYRGDE